MHPKSHESRPGLGPDGPKGWGQVALVTCHARCQSFGFRVYGGALLSRAPSSTASTGVLAAAMVTIIATTDTLSIPFQMKKTPGSGADDSANCGSVVVVRRPLSVFRRPCSSP